MTVEDAREILRRKLEEEDVEIVKVWFGPRHNEVGFTAKDGSNVVLSLRTNI